MDHRLSRSMSDVRCGYRRDFVGGGPLKRPDGLDARMSSVDVRSVIGASAHLSRPLSARAHIVAALGEVTNEDCGRMRGSPHHGPVGLAMDRSVSIQPSACGRVLNNWNGISPQPIEVGWHFGVYHKHQPASGHGPNRRCPRRDDDHETSRVALTVRAGGCQRHSSR